MTNTNVKKKRISCGLFDSLKFNWDRRRHIWRASLFYSIVSWVLSIGIILSGIFYFFISRFHFFVNYSCSPRSITLINVYILAIVICTGITVVISILLSILCKLLADVPINQLADRKRFGFFVGFTVKWSPWFMAVVVWIWLLIQLSGLVWVFSKPQQWCENRFDELAVNAVRNCRLIVNNNTPCQIVLENLDAKEVRNCNNPDFLIRRKMVLLALKDRSSKCSVDDLSVCNAYRDAIEKDDFRWDEQALSGCHGTIPSDMRDFIDEKNTSDLYKYILLFFISWSVILVAMICLFYFIKNVSQFEAMVYQPRDPSDNIVIKIIRPFTPWTD